jgi:hypothetical protein
MISHACEGTINCRAGIGVRETWGGWSGWGSSNGILAVGMLQERRQFALHVRGSDRI